MTAQDDKLSACIFRLRQKTPFFGALALFLRYGLDDRIPTACTDGVRVLFNPAFVDSLTAVELDAVMVHELLHAALLHVPRRGTRDPQLWNVAADIVINGMIRKEPGLKLPLNPCIDAKLENHEVEEVYEVLRSRSSPPDITWIGADLLPGDEAGDESHHHEIKAYWQQSLQQAAAVQRMHGQGDLPTGLQRLIDGITDPQIDWRSALWRFLVRTPVDFTGFDRRLIGQGIYLEALDGESVSVRIAIDTSGSITNEQLATFLQEVREILRLYPQIDCELYYADAALFGPFTPDHEDFEKPVGGGGTSFVPFFDRMDEQLHTHDPAVLVYLTDGFGTFPNKTPDHPVLWVVTPGGLESENFPFGNVVRLRG
jgi:predicted metal-dependent peptidase